MSGYSALADGTASTQPKTISRRLLNMKFMQRASASTTHNTARSSPSTPTGERAPKRRRTGDFSATVNNLESPSIAFTPTSTPAHADRTTDPNGYLIKRGNNDFETAGEETEWILDVRIPGLNGRVNSANDYSDEDDSSDSQQDEIWSPTAPRGRQTYGSFDKKKRKTTNTNTGTANTPVSTSNPSKKRGRPTDEEDDEDLSSLSSKSNADESSDGEIVESPKPKKKSGKFNFKSEADLRKMDAFDLQRSGAQSGFGRQRHGLSGSGGGGGGGNAYGSPGYGNNTSSGKKHKKKARKTM